MMKDFLKDTKLDIFLAFIKAHHKFFKQILILLFILLLLFLFQTHLDSYEFNLNQQQKFLFYQQKVLIETIAKLKVRTLFDFFTTNTVVTFCLEICGALGMVLSTYLLLAADIVKGKTGRQWESDLTEIDSAYESLVGQYSDSAFSVFFNVLYILLFLYGLYLIFLIKNAKSGLELLFIGFIAFLTLNIIMDLDKIFLSLHRINELAELNLKLNYINFTLITCLQLKLDDYQNSYVEHFMAFIPSQSLVRAGTIFFPILLKIFHYFELDTDTIVYIGNFLFTILNDNIVMRKGYKMFHFFPKHRIRSVFEENVFGFENNILSLLDTIDPLFVVALVVGAVILILVTRWLFKQYSNKSSKKLN